MPTAADAMDELQAGLPGAIRQLVRLAHGEDRRAALRALTLLERYLHAPASIAATEAADDAAVTAAHLEALRAVQQWRQRLLEPAPDAKH